MMHEQDKRAANETNNQLGMLFKGRKTLGLWTEIRFEIEQTKT